MNEVSVAAESVYVGKKTVKIISNLRRSYTLYLDVGGASKKVLGPHAAADGRVVIGTAARTIDPDWGIVVITDDLQDIEQLTIYGIERPAAGAVGPFAGKLSA